MSRRVKVKFISPTPATVVPDTSFSEPTAGNPPRPRMDMSKRDPADGSAGIYYTGTNSTDLGFVIGLGGTG